MTSNTPQSRKFKPGDILRMADNTIRSPHTRKIGELATLVSYRHPEYLNVKWHIPDEKGNTNDICFTSRFELAFSPPQNSSGPIEAIQTDPIYTLVPRADLHHLLSLLNCIRDDAASKGDKLFYSGSLLRLQLVLSEALRGAPSNAKETPILQQGQTIRPAKPSSQQHQQPQTTKAPAAILDDPVRPETPEEKERRQILNRQYADYIKYGIWR